MNRFDGGVRVRAMHFSHCVEAPLARLLATCVRGLAALHASARLGRLATLSASALVVVLLLMSKPAMAAGTWFDDERGYPTPCGVVYTGGASDVIDQWENCLTAQYTQINGHGSASWSQSLSNCTTTPPTDSTNGVTNCLTTWLETDSTGTHVFETGYVSSSACPTSMIFDSSVNGDCIAVRDEYYLCPHCFGYGNPIYPLTGVRAQSEDLGIRLAGRSVSLGYDTEAALPTDSGATNLTEVVPPSFGALWTSSLHKLLDLQSSGHSPMTAGNTALLFRGDRVTSFMLDSGTTCNGAGGSTNKFLPTTNHAQQLSYDDSGSGTLIEGADLGMESYDASGRITRVDYGTGGWLVYAYSSAAIPNVAPTAGLLLSATDHTGRSVQFTYEQPDTSLAPRINTATAPDGSLTQFFYDGAGNLQKIVWPDQQVRTFRYERPDLPWALTGITDESSQIYSTYGYDAAGRATSTQLSSGVNSYTASYEAGLPTWQVTQAYQNDYLCRTHRQLPPGPVVVTNPANFTTTLTPVSANGMTKASREDQPAGSGSAASSIQYGYDTNGSVSGVVDANGNQTCTSYDLTRDLPLVRIEGMPSTPGAQPACPTDLAGYALAKPGDAGYDPMHPQRKVTTSWLDRWNLPMKRAEPGKLTTWIYNGRGASCAAGAPSLPDGSQVAVVCSRTEQATNDPTGANGFSATVTGNPRTWTYTYDQFGQLFTEIAPGVNSSDSSHLTTYVYYTDASFPDGRTGHSVGDLQSVSRRVSSTSSLTTQYTSYDKAGRLLSMTNPNGTVTTMTYWPRGWLHTRTVAPSVNPAQTTTYAYFPTGLLQTASLPDGTQLNYQYDVAHRLTDVYDGAGNHVHYGLDKLGEVTLQQVSDTSGQLAATIARTYDALQRLQSVTGAPN